MNIIEIKNVSYVYSKGTPFQKVALDNVSDLKNCLTLVVVVTTNDVYTLV